MAEPLVSVILPVYNRAGSVARSIDSVLAQSYRPLEIVVVDDGSTDGTRAVLESFGDRITLLAQPHGGAYVARNLALRHARGELVAFLDSDDVWLPDRLALQVPLMRRDEVGLVFGDALHVPGAKRTCFDVSPPHRGRVAECFAAANFVPTVTVLARRRCIDEAGGFSEESEISCDYLLWFRIASAHELDYVDRLVAEYTVHAGGISYDLGRSLAARIELFSGELRRAGDAATRAIVRRLLFNLALRLVLAAVRGRARSVERPLRLAWRTAASVAGFKAAPWTAAFAFDEVRVRARRLV
jgi:glycosyltransferase involved in cell wall biosynthesis